MPAPSSPPQYLTRFDAARAMIRRAIAEDPNLSARITDGSDYELMEVLTAIAASVMHSVAVQIEIAAAQGLIDTVDLISPMIVLAESVGDRVRGYRPAALDIVAELAAVPTATVEVWARNGAAATDADARGRAVTYYAAEALEVGDVRLFEARHYDASADTYTDVTDELRSLAGSAVAILPATVAVDDRIEVILPAGLMVDTLAWDLTVASAGITLKWAVFNGHAYRATLLSVTVGASTLTLTFRLPSGMPDASGLNGRVTYAPTAARQSECNITYSAGVHTIVTTTAAVVAGEANGHLGQTTPSTDLSDYQVTLEWLPAIDADGTASLTVDGDVTLLLPSDRTRPEGARWEAGLPDDSTDLRRVVAGIVTVSAGPTTPQAESVQTDQGKAYCAVALVQGLLVLLYEIGTSDASARQVHTFGASEAVFEGAKVYVDTGGGPEEWETVDHLLSSGAADQHAVVRRSPTPGAGFQVEFGDGTNGAIPGAGTVHVSYAVQADIDGNVAARTVTKNADGQATIARLWNPLPGVGWQAQDGDTPALFEELRRRVQAEARVQTKPTTLEDYEAFSVAWVDARGASPVARAFARAHDSDTKTVVVVVVGGGGGLLSADSIQEMEDYFGAGSTGIRMANHAIEIVNYAPHTVNVTATVKKSGVAYGGFSARVGAAIRAYLDPTAVDASGHRFAPGSTVEVNKILAAIFRDVPELMLDPYAVAVTSPAADFTLSSVGLPVAGTVTVNGASV